jgi:hypothetical protein
MVGGRYVIWDQIILIMEKLEGHFDVVQQTEALSLRVHIEISKAWMWLGDKAQVPKEVIKFTKRKNQSELIAIDVNDRTSMVIVASEVHTKRNLILTT